MDREAFKQRMQNLKSYREQNPGKGYLDWKASLPDNLQDESSYNLQRAYELGYEPEYIEEDRSYHLPTRDQETGEILKKPWHPTFLIGLQEDAKLGYYPQTINGTTYTTTWEGNENPIYKYADGGEVPPTNKPTIIEPIPYKGKLYSDRYGRKYTEEQVYDYYNNGTDEIDRFTGGPLVRGLKPLLDLEDAANFTPVGDAVAAYDVYDAVSNRDWSGAGLAALGLVPFMPMTVKQFRSKYNGIDNRDWYFTQPTEQKAHMNQLREYMFNNGHISRRGQAVSPKMMKKVIEEVSNIDSMREVARASRQFNNINKYTRWFNAIPLLGLGAAAMYNNNQKE